MNKKFFDMYKNDETVRIIMTNLSNPQSFDVFKGDELIGEIIYSCGHLICRAFNQQEDFGKVIDVYSEKRVDDMLPKINQKRILDICVDSIYRRQILNIPPNTLSESSCNEIEYLFNEE